MRSLSRLCLALALALLAVLVMAPAPAQGQVEATDPAESTGTVTGVVLDWTSSKPVISAIVRLPALDRETISDRAGRFRFADVQRGEHDIQIGHLAYGTRAATVEVPGEAGRHVEIRISPRAIAIDGVEVVVRSAAEEHRRRTGARVDLMTRADIEAREGLAHHVGHLIQGRFPGVSVRIVNMPDPDDAISMGGRVYTERRLCVASQRARTACAVVFLDGVRMHDSGIHLQHLGPDEIESIEFLPPMRAALRYGRGVGGRGVLEIWTRGQGPYAERPGR